MVHVYGKLPCVFVSGSGKELEDVHEGPPSTLFWTLPPQPLGWPEGTEAPHNRRIKVRKETGEKQGGLQVMRGQQRNPICAPPDWGGGGVGVDFAPALQKRRLECEAAQDGVWRIT